MNYEEYLYNADYNTLKRVLISKSITELQQILQDPIIKEKIIKYV